MSSEDLNGAGVPSSKMTQSHGFWREFVPFWFIQKGALLMAPGSPQSKWFKREQRGSPLWPSFGSHTPSLLILWILRSESLNPAIPREDFQRISKYILKSPHWYMVISKARNPFQNLRSFPTTSKPCVWVVHSLPQDRAKGGEPIWAESLKCGWCNCLKPMSWTHFQSAVKWCICFPVDFNGSQAAKVSGHSLQLDLWVCWFLVWIAELRNSVWVSAWPCFIPRLPAELLE